MAIDITVLLDDQPGALAQIGEVLGRGRGQHRRSVRGDQRRQASRGARAVATSSEPWSGSQHTPKDLHARTISPTLCI